MSDTFERIADWLQRVALLDVGLEELIEGLGTRLVEAGVPVVRISQGRLLMHPIIGVIDVTWDADAKRTDWAVILVPVCPVVLRNITIHPLQN